MITIPEPPAPFPESAIGDWYFHRRHLYWLFPQFLDRFPLQRLRHLRLQHRQVHSLKTLRLLRRTCHRADPVIELDSVQHRQLPPKHVPLGADIASNRAPAPPPPPAGPIRCCLHRLHQRCLDRIQVCHQDHQLRHPLLLNHRYRHSHKSLMRLPRRDHRLLP